MLSLFLVGHLQGEWGEDSCGEVVPGLRKWQGAGGAVAVFAT